MINERIKTATIVVGVVLTVLSASVVGTLEASVPELMALWGNPIWIAYLIFTVLFGGALQLTHSRYRTAVVSSTQ